jgi:uncharacterized membrane protein
MDDGYQVIFAVFGSRDDALEQYDRLTDLGKEKSVAYLDAAVLEHDADGKVKFVEQRDRTGVQDMKWGAAIGAVVGLLFPPGLIVSALVGGAIGGAAGAIHDTGLPTHDLQEMSRALTPGKGALVVVAGDAQMDAVAAAVAGAEEVNRRAIPPDVAEQFKHRVNR